MFAQTIRNLFLKLFSPTVFCLAHTPYDNRFPSTIENNNVDIQISTSSCLCLVSFAILGLADNQVQSDENYTERPGTEGNGNFVIGPDYTLDPDLTDRGNPKGKDFQFTMSLTSSKIFRGDDSTLEPKKKVRTERKIFVYVPASYKDGTKAPILVMHDGPGNLDKVRYALDNLTVAKDVEHKLPAFIAIAVENGGDDSKGSHRGLEYDTMSDRLARFINDEVLPAVLINAEIKAAYPKIAFTENPWGKAAMGCSSGGAATPGHQLSRSAAKQRPTKRPMRTPCCETDN